jgi:methyl-accepting chemotaxis protein PixJ
MITIYDPLFTIHCPLSTIHYPLSTIHYPLSTIPMNSKQTQIEVATAKTATSAATPFQTIRNFARNNLVGTIATTIAGSLMLTGISTYNIWNIYNSFQSTVTRQFDLQKTSDDLLYVDEYFTMSAKMLVATGDTQWETRYKKMLPKNDALFIRIKELLPPDLWKQYEANGNASGLRLLKMENKSFALMTQGKQKEAAAILLGEDYSKDKKIFSDGNNLILEKVDRSIKQELKNYQQQLLISIVFAGSTLPLLIGGWILVLSAVRDYIRDRQIAQIELQQSQTSLLSLNQALKTESQVREQQELNVRKERDVLQQDIGHLLDVVCEIESGDFTIQAQVNDRATGLIGDTLNRLVESLGGVMSQVSVSAQRVAVNSSRQDKIAAAVAQNTGEQTHSVNQMLALTETVRRSANNTAIQLQDTNQSLVMLQTAVTDGEMTVGSLDREIDVLQQGSDRIVQQMKTLGEFVGLADRFVHDQSDIATQTQVLALNASLVAARAAEQRDPKQFEAVAREFESIASQVSQLAQQTNEGLTSLEQRNTQIHRVVSDVDGEVQRLGGLVNSFTQGVKQTREVFATVQSVTGKVVTAGEVVFQTSQTIIESADSTAKSISEIATLSTQIDRESQSARSISTQMSDLSTELLSNIQIFKLPFQETAVISPLVAEIPTAEPEAPSIDRELDYQLN